MYCQVIPHEKYLTHNARSSIVLSRGQQYSNHKQKKVIAFTLECRCT